MIRNFFMIMTVLLKTKSAKREWKVEVLSFFLIY